MDDDDETNEVVRIVLGAVTLRQRTLFRRDYPSTNLNPKLLNENCTLKKKSVNYDSIGRCLNGVTMIVASQAAYLCYHKYQFSEAGQSSEDLHLLS